MGNVASMLHPAVQQGDTATVEALLDEGGNDALHAQDTAGRTALHVAALYNKASIAELLLSKGARADAQDVKYRTPLHFAALMNSVDAAAVLIHHGAMVDSKDMVEDTPLYHAAGEDHVEMAALLILSGASVDSVNSNHKTSLHIAAEYNRSRMTSLLLSYGAAINIKDMWGRTPLQRAIFYFYHDLGNTLISHGADVSMLDEDGKHALMCLVLNEINISRDPGQELSLTKKLIAAGASWTDRDDRLAHRIARENRAGFLLDWGEKEILSLVAAIQGWIAQRSLSPAMELTRLPSEVYERGAEDVSAYFKSVNKALRESFVSGNEAPASAGPNVGASDTVAANPGLVYRKKLCVVGPSNWGKTSFVKSFTTNTASLEAPDCRTMGIDLFSWSFTSSAKISSSPKSASTRNRSSSFGSVDSQDETMSAPERQYHVSLWDFAGQDEYQSAHSLFYSKRTMYVVCVNLREYADTLAVSELQVPGAPNAKMDAFVEDKIYRWIRAICAHVPDSEFVFVGTKADLIFHDTTIADRVSVDMMTRLARRESQVVRQLDRAIATMRKEAKKPSLRPSSSKEVSPSDPVDVSMDNPVQTSSMDGLYQRQLLSLENLRRKRPRYLSTTLLALSSADLSGMPNVRNALEHHIIESDSSFPMPESYLRVDTFLRERVARVAEETSPLDHKARVEGTFVALDELRAAIAAERSLEDLTPSDVTAILHVLHCLGDLLWFDESSDALSGIVFLRPELVIDFIRQVLNHQLGDEKFTSISKSAVPGPPPSSSSLADMYTAVREEGRVEHELLCRLEMWRDIDDDKLMVQLKELLFHFQLAYPAGSTGMKWNSDLIVPIYWSKKRDDMNLSTLVDNDKMRAALPVSVCWEYEFHLHLPENIFEKLGVQSYSAHFSSNRVFGHDFFETSIPGQYCARVQVFTRSPESQDDSTDDDTIVTPTVVLSINVSADTYTLAWRQLVWYSMSLEKLLEGYPGVWVTRYAVSPTSGKHFELDELIVEQREMQSLNQALGLQSDPNTSAYNSGLLPPSMEWYTKKKWKGRSLLQPNRPRSQQPKQLLAQQTNDINHRLTEMEERFSVEQERMLNRIVTLVAADGNRRDYPALWTLEYQLDNHANLSATYILKLRSHLSGKCYHRPIEIVVGGTFFAKYGIYIKHGLSLFASVVPSKYIVSVCTTEVERAMAVHSLVSGLDLHSYGSMNIEASRTLSPDETIVVLRDLLKVWDPSFDVMKMSKISGLQCGIVRSTLEHIWAHPNEIQSRIADIRFRHEYLNLPGDRSPRSACSSSNAGSGSPSGSPTNSPSLTASIPTHRRSRSSPTVPVPLGTPPSPGVLRLHRHSLSSAKPPPSAPVTLQIIRVLHLRNVRLTGTQSPYCKWKLISSNGREIKAGMTNKDYGGGCNPNWSTQLFDVGSKDNLAAFNGCALVFRVKTTRAMRISELIAEGSFTFHDIADLGSGGLASEQPVTLLAKGLAAGTLVFKLHT